MRPLVTHSTRRAAALSLLSAALCGCSPLLYALLAARADNVGEIVADTPVRGSTTHNSDSYAVECAGDDGEDAAYQFVPPVSGRWRARVTGDYDTVVALFEDGRQIACNDDFRSTRESQVDAQLTAGQRYTVVVDGYHGTTGAYELTVTPTPANEAAAPPDATAVMTDAPTHAARCETAPYLSAGVSEGVLRADTATTRVSCGSRGPGGDVVYRYVVESPGTLLVSEASDFDAIVELRGGCAGTERVVACGDDAPDVRHSGVSGHLTPGVYFLVVDGYSAAAQGRFTLQTSWHPDSVVTSVDIATDAAAVAQIASDDAGVDASTDAGPLRRVVRDGGVRR